MILALSRMNLRLLDVFAFDTGEAKEILQRAANTANMLTQTWRTNLSNTGQLATS